MIRRKIRNNNCSSRRRSLSRRNEYCSITSLERCNSSRTPGHE